MKKRTQDDRVLGGTQGTSKKIHNLKNKDIINRTKTKEYKIY